MADLLKPNGIKDNSKRRGIPAQAKAKRREEAQKRQSAYDKLTLAQKLERPYLGAKERAKLTSRLQSQKGS